MLATRIGLFLALFAVPMLPLRAEEFAHPPVIAIVAAAHQEAGDLQLAAGKLKLIYLRKQLYWPNGKRIFPVNLQTEHVLRRAFSQGVLGSLPAEQVDYWNGLYFNGIRPPHVVNSEEAVMRYVAQTPGAIGYVDACKVDERVQPLLWLSGDRVLSALPDNLDCH